MNRSVISRLQIDLRLPAPKNLRAIVALRSCCRDESLKKPRDPLSAVGQAIHGNGFSRAAQCWRKNILLSAATRRDRRRPPS